MIVDFQHHFTPRELFKEDLGDKLIIAFDETGAPSYTSHKMLYDLDEHIRMMDMAGIDAAFLTSASAMCADLDRSKFINDKAKQAERDYPGRFVGAAHAHPLGGAACFQGAGALRHELGFPGAVITSEADGLFLDAPEFEPFWAEAVKLGLFVFVHPALKLNFSQQFDAYDTRALGRARILADHGDDQADQWRRLRPPSVPHCPYGASRRRHRIHAWPYPKLSGQGLLGLTRQRQTWPHLREGLRLLPA